VKGIDRILAWVLLYIVVGLVAIGYLTSIGVL
jgi:hypothetical protein